jgi:putative tryptophan/tyrosine transport system substrate-binding protein
MRRRDVVSFAVGAAVGWSLAARAQQAALPVIGFVSARSPGDSDYLVAAFRRGLSEAGYREGENVAILSRWAEGHYDRLQSLVTDLISRQVAVLVAVGGDPCGLAAKAATSTIPIVFTVGADPVKLGLVASIDRPGGNVTGFSLLTAAMEAKRLGLLHEIVPNAAVIGVLLNPTNPNAISQTAEVETAARKLDQRIEVVHASADAEFDTAFATLLQKRADGLLVCADPFFDTTRQRIIAFAAQHRIPAMYQFREYAIAGGLVSYGVSLTDGYRQVGIYTGRILKGANPAELPVMQSVKFEMVINMKAAAVLGLTFPQNLMAQADEVIE